MILDKMTIEKIGIICITIICIINFFTLGINGVMYGIIIATIAGIVGYELKLPSFKIKKEKYKKKTN